MGDRWVLVGVSGIAARTVSIISPPNRNCNISFHCQPHRRARWLVGVLAMEDDDQTATVRARWGRVPGAVAGDKALNESALRVLICLCEHADEASECWPAQRTVAERTGLARSAVNRALSLLEAQGWISRKRRYRENGAQTATLYRIHMARTAPLSSLAGHPPVLVSGTPPCPR